MTPNCTNLTFSNEAYMSLNFETLLPTCNIWYQQFIWPVSKPMISKHNTLVHNRTSTLVWRTRGWKRPPPISSPTINTIKSRISNMLFWLIWNFFFLNPSGTTEIPLYILFQCDVLEPAVPGHSCQGRQLLWTGSTGWRSQHTAVWYPWWRSVGDPLHSQSSTTQLKYKIIHKFY